MQASWGLASNEQMLEPRRTLQSNSVTQRFSNAQEQNTQAHRHLTCTHQHTCALWHTNACVLNESVKFGSARLV
eukprot:1160258-Pelagomonas_calceolata.AAC.1